MSTVPNLNDGSGKDPTLRIYISMGNVETLPGDSAGPRGSPEEQLVAIRAVGYQGIQGEHPALCRSLGLGCAASARYNLPTEVAPSVRELKAAGYEGVTVHAGWGHESDQEVDALVREIIAVASGENFPIYIETHRATITQDSWRTVKMVERHPDVRFNADFSHWYTGLEMVYGDLQKRFEFIAPVLERVRFIHGRMGNSGHIQLPLDEPSMAVAAPHFLDMWTRALRGFLRSASSGDYIVFAPELLHPEINYARTFVNAAGERVEESDRWLEALRYKALIEGCFAAAKQ
ncbi:sugar phosphate isomerase/epimerase family protein [Paucibacter sp. M5-1]|uniref:sugar phosphate isomerase/epimerase family protein n=1 Tax=Paucibacter sp. M5-1 TaxID=3015998 RepID=UPI0022B87010|nr:hypothetical protein [Paucibacter sp. M5-1]MCZ7883046.1 hypothetical protein [Paucibacter sp. M5-1]